MTMSKHFLDNRKVFSGKVRCVSESKQNLFWYYKNKRIVQSRTFQISQSDQSDGKTVSTLTINLTPEMKRQKTLNFVCKPEDGSFLNTFVLNSKQ